MRGDSFELTVKHRLEREGWVVFRVKGSRLVDLVAVKPNVITLVECKSDGSIPREQLTRLLRLAEKCGAGFS
ncbi:hypothetical protein J7L70_09045 [Candidatus Bathyarchaeota archaeon]|nr:hypothetical protein [Candidatus Bathyarchaeota archaeon]